jgi:hypothetical protein
MKGLENNEFEIPVGTARNWLAGSKSDLDAAFRNMNH